MRRIHTPIAPAKSEPAFLPLLLLLTCAPWARPQPDLYAAGTGESQLKGVTTARRTPQARLLDVCACFVVKKGRAFCIECIALCSPDAPETRNLSWHGRVPNEAARFALCSP